MRPIILVSLLFISVYVSGQHLNFAGHLIENSSNTNNHSSAQVDNSEQIITLPLIGNTKFRTHFGYITLQSNDDDAVSVVRIYNLQGILQKQMSFRQTINFKLSNDLTFAAFHDTRSIQLIDFEKLSVTQIDGSTIFEFSEDNFFAYYNEENHAVHFKGKIFSVTEQVNKLLFFQNKLLITLRNNLSIAEGNSLRKVFSEPSENIFDVEEIGNKLFISTKKVFSENFEFKSFFTRDLISFAKDETVIYPLKHFANNKTPNNTRTSTLPGEQIRNPINYYQDTVYQPVGNSYDEIQDYSMGANIYPHPGVDLLGIFFQDVYSVKPGFVKAILTTSAEFHWRIAIGNENIPDSSTGYLYAHLEETSIPYVVGDSVAEGELIGQLVDFPVVGFVHCHFARIYDEGFTWSGEWWTYDNPLSYMTNFYDSMPPVFEKTIGNDEFAFRDSSGIYLSPDSLFGKVKIISKVYDQINSTWKVDVNKLRYSLSPLSSPQTMLLDIFAYEFNFFNDNYNSGPYLQLLLQTIYSFDQTCYSIGNYTDRDFYHIITNSDGNDTIDATDSLLFFDTRIFADGDYIFRVTAFDPSENSTSDSMIIRIRNLSTNLNGLNETSDVSISPNPFDRYVQINFEKEITRIENLSVKDLSGKEVYSKPTVHTLNENKIQIGLGSLATGVYFISFNYGDEVFSGKLICK
ncbi:MAG: T9SS type A sorting domain-containing protein [Bacteroidia bacterium]|nr:T9SS type A sorting domain-containing protein [Bacteroidia bacterium]